ncbi:NmrA family NAD(P)-binding protein [Rhodococcus sp. BP-349]|uniref:NmrA family NAD(P)-binding protein n=1 Tax=unclassified Rhodococcus (in: high G+C Gram-positive bacteria) TaxID=192944 RepID=UPI001C9B10A9|nr:MULTISPECIES: NmrA family NAD(P)-binding protein [unclassified Rhodococcus (in: high G+C Gram-positive bacteria)]MBY6537442.1 NmrA family NAD(P)-binding protein [Rhodococcus sp. BP-363]MBY6541779.1 NmrA family NAD(P)-binding protein [Rhodococcus sp. BP-369]MBY6561009.1 NmrA family NAD(P)-binding protein [Rhodococcus sp. BP-370]MBY6575301.1 NmrA family NAD(P)-binding protein [Rhodococcus sp. BP-364]MBY6584602.1 NmrA family NAD(P)-binding protein [Rhodococcus sp. BP-358]
MTTTAVTGATGQLGNAVIRSLLDHGVAAGDIVAVVRDEAKAADLAARGVIVRVADYADPAALRTAFVGVDKVLLVSSSEVGQRVPQHTNVIEAAEAAGVSLIAYTSVLKAATSGISLAPEHVATEERLASSSVPSVLLRNGWYWENYAAFVDQARHTGAIVGSGGAGVVAGASRTDFAAAAAAVLIADDQAGAVYELGGERLTYEGVAAAIAEIVGSRVEYQNLTTDEHIGALEGAGLPAPVAQMLASADAGIARGDLDTESGDLARLLGREPGSAVDALRATLS